MKLTLRVIMGVVVGLVIAWFVVAFADEVGNRLYAVPACMNWFEAARVAHYISGLPLGANLLTLAGWIGATLFGAVVGSSFARPRAGVVSGIVGGLVLAVALANFVLTPHPAWVVLTAIIGIALAICLAIKLMWKPEAAISA